MMLSERTTAASFVACVRANRVPTRSELLDAADELERLAQPQPDPFCASLGGGVNLARFFDAKAEWSRKTFGEHQSHVGVVAHIRKELLEIEAHPRDGVEWCDVVLLAMDGAWRAAGLDGAAFVELLAAKQKQNTERAWPDWRSVAPDVPIEHVKAEPPADPLGPLREAVLALLEEHEAMQVEAHGYNSTQAAFWSGHIEAVSR